MKAYAMSFDGALLARGFWLYVWRIVAPAETVLYVGRTGDSSSPHASSPFRRIGQHLDVRANAKGNALGRQLARAGLDPTCCTFDMVGIGPVFAEQIGMPAHVVFRDRAAVLEGALAVHLSGRGYTVLGEHPTRSLDSEPELFEEIRGIVDAQFPAVTRST